MSNSNWSCPLSGPVRRGFQRPTQRRAGVLRAAIVLGLMGWACQAADVVYTNFANSGPTNAFASSLVVDGGNPGSSIAQVFTTPAQDYVLQSISIALSDTTGTGAYSVAIMTSNSTGDPGTIVEEINVTAVPSSTGDTVVPTVVNSVTHPTLTANTTYWLAVIGTTATTYGYWQGNTISQLATASGPTQVDIAPAFQGFDGGPWTPGLVNGRPVGAFQIMGTISGAPVPPILTSLVPNTVASGSPAFTMTVNGTGFLNGATIQWSGLNLSTTFLSAVQLQATVPSTLVGLAGQSAITATNPGSAASNILYVTVASVPTVTITSLSPSSTLVGGQSFTLTLTGSNFASDALVYFGSTPLYPVIGTGGTQLTVTIPAALITTAGTRSVTVIQATGVSNALSFTVSSSGTVSLTALSPSSAVAGGPNFTLTITGSNFTSNAAVHFGASTLAPSSVTPTQIQVTVPSSLIATAGTASVTVVQSGTTSNAITFTIAANSNIVLNSVAPSFTLAGGADFTLLIAGANFVPGATVRFGSVILTPFSVTASQILVVVPASAIASVGVPSITVLQASGTSNSLSITVGLQSGQTLAIATGGVLPSGKVGVAYSATLVATGGAAPYSWTITGSGLPPGLLLSPDGSITGTPTSSGSVFFSATATDSASATVTKSFILAIADANSGASITTPASLPDAVVGSAYSQTLSATGGTAPYVWSVLSGSLPAGLTLSSTGLISGTPTLQESSTFKVQVVDKLQATSSLTFSLTVNPAGTGAIRSGVFSQVASGGGWKSSIYLVNGSANAVAVVLKFWSDSGNVLNLPLVVTQAGSQQTQTAASIDEIIAPNATLLVESDAQTTVSATGWVELLSTARIAGFGVLHYTSSSGAVSEATVPLETTFTPSFLLPFDSLNGLTAGVALTNLVAAQPATVTATIWDESGSQVGSSSINLPAGGHASFLLADRLPATTSNRGVIEFSAGSTNYVSGLGLRINPAGGLTLIPKLARQ